jgi:hypothetical protein
MLGQARALSEMIAVIDIFYSEKLLALIYSVHNVGWVKRQRDPTYTFN